MHSKIRILTHLCLAAGVLLLASCGKSNDETQSDADTASQTTPAAVVVADAPMKGQIEAAGYKPIYFHSFPSPLPGIKAHVVVYRGGGSEGGVLYVQEYGHDYRPVWHWYFAKDAPDSVNAVEINEDGLWDVRMYVDGEPRDYVQDQSFSFSARQRGDLMAMNGEASEPVDANGMTWYAFDGDTTTAWRTDADDAFIDLPVPLGVEAGILAIQLGAEDQPRKVEIKADGKKVQEFELDETTLEQDIQLDEAAKKADVLRVEFKSTHRGAENVAVTELGLK